MTDIPSDFDSALLQFSDYLPSPQSEDPSTAAIQPRSPDNFSDDLEALHQVIEERRIQLTKEGVVIQHRQRGLTPIFRSSSLPPETPTRKGPKRAFQLLTSNLLLSEDIAEDSDSSQCTLRASQMAIGGSQLSYPLSSPPPDFINPKKRKATLAEDDNDDEAFTYPDSGDDDEGTQGMETQEGGASASISGEDSQLLPPPIPVDNPEETPPNRPIFNLPFTGGLFSKKLTASTTSSYLVKATGVGKSSPDNSPFVPLTRRFRTEVTPPPQPPLPGPSGTDSFSSAFGSPVSPSRRVPSYLSSAPRPASVKKATETCSYLSIVTSSGETFQTRQNPAKSISARDDYYMSNVSILGDKPSEESSSIRKSYYGIDIHSLLGEYKAERDLAAARQRDEQSDTPENLATSNLMRGDSAAASKSQKTPMWTEKYRAKRFADLVGDERTHRQVLRWFKSWDKTVFPSNKPTRNTEGEDEREMRKILLIHGPPGLGKTTLAHVAAKQAGYDVVEVNASDDRSAAVVKGRIKDILSNEGVKRMSMLAAGGKQKPTKVAVGKPVCLVIDEIDGVTGGTGAGANEGGFIKALIDLVMADQKLNNPAEGATRKKGRRKGDTFKLQRPIVAVCNDLYVPALKALRPLAEVVHMRKPPTGPMVVRLKSILEHEGFRTEDGAVRRLVELSCMGGNTTGKAAGDMRAAVIGCEWIACRLRSAAMKFANDPKTRREQKILTRKIVEQEFGDGGLGEGDGKGGGGGRGNVREVVERVFCTEKETKRAGSKDTSRKKSSGEKLREAVEGQGEFDKIIMDCFATYPTRPFNDDPFLTKPNAAYEWLHFSDLLSTRVFQEQEYELAGYLSHPIVAFHHIFCSPQRDSSAGRYKPFEEETDAPPFTGPTAEWEVREGVKATKALIQNVHSCLAGIRLNQCFQSAESVAMELAPWVSRILSPSIKPVVVGGSGFIGSIASVRREGEKRLVNRGVEVMCCMGIEFEKIRVEGITTTGSGWIYRMEPPIDTLSVYRTLAVSAAEPAAAPVRYAIRQVLDQEYKKELLRRRELSRQARMGASDHVPQLKKAGPSADPTAGLKRKIKEVKKDFFGRIVAREEDQDTEEGRRKKRKQEKEERDEEQKVWLSFHEGFSNAVRKGITLEELMSGLV